MLMFPELAKDLEEDKLELVWLGESVIWDSSQPDVLQDVAVPPTLHVSS